VEILLIRSEDPAAGANQDFDGVDSGVAGSLALAGTVTAVSVAQVRPPRGRSPRFRLRGLGGAGSSASSVASGPTARTADSLDELRAGTLSCDVLVTSGWAALLACEQMGVLSDAHVLEDFATPIDAAAGASAHDDARKLELVDRARRILAVSESDVRRLRARGRFPTLLLAKEDVPNADSSSRVSVIPIGRLATWVRGIAPVGRAEKDLGEVLRSAAQRSIPDLAGLLSACLDGREPGRVQTVNLHHICLARTSPVFKEILGTAHAITADGWPIVRLLNSAGYAVDRVTGADLVGNLLSDPRASGLRLALIGGAEEPGAAFEQLAAEAGATVVLRDHGDKRDWDPTVLAGELNGRNASLALVAVTQPMGDLLVAELTAAGYHGTAIGIGAAVDLFVGGEHRASPWVQRLRLEWFFRFVQDPKRLWRRYFLEDIPTYLSIVRPMAKRRTLAPPPDVVG
jgi:N-acetylglucosaminyldiphosphoundecaprenol N-acetyl-beta-D-mannosaminyltransferase